LIGSAEGSPLLEPVVQVLPESAFRDEILQHRVRGRQNPHVAPANGVTADGANLPRLQARSTRLMASVRKDYIGPARARRSRSKGGEAHRRARLPWFLRGYFASAQSQPPAQLHTGRQLQLSSQPQRSLWASAQAHEAPWHWQLF
jgi:hypothetical protein